MPSEFPERWSRFLPPEDVTARLRAHVKTTHQRNGEGPSDAARRPSRPVSFPPGAGRRPLPHEAGEVPRLPPQHPPHPVLQVRVAAVEQGLEHPGEEGRLPRRHPEAEQRLAVVWCAGTARYASGRPVAAAISATASPNVSSRVPSR
ncbi:hypothetical protein SVIOM342S_05055 [Streptomyces violaceorubidus]